MTREAMTLTEEQIRRLVAEELGMLEVKRMVRQIVAEELADPTKHPQLDRLLDRLDCQLKFIDRYQTCAKRIWAMFKDDPLPHHHPAHGHLERLEALIDLGLIDAVGLLK